MKKLLIVTGILIFAFTMGINAQTGKLAKLFDDYKNSKGYTSVDLNANITINDDDGDNMIEKIDAIRILNIDNDDFSTEEVKAFFAEAHKIIKKQGFEEMLNITDDGESVIFFVKNGSKGKATECVLLSGEDDESTLIYIGGEIDFAKAMEMVGSMDFKCDHDDDNDEDHDRENDKD
jgi:uncharacterized protein DUF4252